MNDLVSGMRSLIGEKSGDHEQHIDAVVDFFVNAMGELGEKDNPETELAHMTDKATAKKVMTAWKALPNAQRMQFRTLKGEKALTTWVESLFGKKSEGKTPEGTDRATLSSMRRAAGLEPEDDLSSYLEARRTVKQTRLEEDVLSGMAGWLKGMDKAVGTWQGKAGNSGADAKVMDGLNDVRKAVLKLQKTVGG